MQWAGSSALRLPNHNENFFGDGMLSPGRAGQDPVLARETAYQVELLRAVAEKEQAFRLRHRLFAETLHWVPEVASGLEIDAYDACTEMIAVLDPQRRVLGQVRVHESSVPFMIEREFATVLGASPIPFKGRDTAEVTRFGVLPEARAEVVQTPYGAFDLFTLLLKGMYLWSKAHAVRTIYAVVDRRVFRLLHLRGFPFEAIAEPKLMPDGVLAVAIRLDWAQFEEQNREHKPGLLAWFGQDGGLQPRLTEVQAGPVSAPWLRPGPGSRRPVLAEGS
jgi:N-acyl-L-homoserine lactone synthetase